MSERLFILRRGGGEDGPYSEEEVTAALAAGDVSPRDWCRLENEPHARMIGEVFGHWPDEEEREEEDAEAAEGDEEEEGENGDRDRGAHTPARGPVESGGAEAPGIEEGEDEEVLVYAGSPSLLGYGWPMAVAAAVLAAGYWLGRFGVEWVVGALAVALLLVARVLLHRGAREYVVTTERVVATVGLLARRRREIRLGDLTSIRLHKRGPLGWLGVGTVIFSSDAAGEEDVVFERIRGVKRVIALVRRA